MKNTFIIILLFISISLFGQKDNTPAEELSPFFDISPDNKNLVISISNKEGSSLYIYSLINHKITPLTTTKGYYTNPIYSPKGDKILFLSKDLNSENSDLYSIHLETKKIKNLTNGKIYVTEASFLPNGEKILYCGAEVVTNYSPMARKAPHKIDLYLTEYDADKSQKLTNFRAYQLSNIQPNKKGDTVLCKLISNNATEGFYLLSLADTVKTKVEVINNPRPEIKDNFYGTPALSHHNKQIAFTAPYQLYIMSLKDHKCEEIWSSFGKEEQAMPIFLRFDKKDEKIFFSILTIVNRRYNFNAKIYSFDIKTKKLTRIEIPLRD
ncbi:hypothetical protein AD998_11285 [bacterium 336/3]|nr:hypothetical protein AD998_11285 [bacterium 336/3]